MADSKISNEGSLSEVQGKFRKISKGSKQAKKASDATTKFRKAKGLPTKPSKAWLQQPVKIRKIKPAKGLKGMKRVKPSSKAAGKISLGALKSFRPSSQVPEWNGIPLIPVISSNIGSIGYDDAEKTLIVSFLDASIYEYYNVPETVWWRFQTASSKGKFLWTDLRDKFMYERVL